MNSLQREAKRMAICHISATQDSIDEKIMQEYQNAD